MNELNNNTEVMENEAVEAENERDFDFAGAGTLALAAVGAGTILCGACKGAKKLYGWAKGKIASKKAKKAEKSEAEEVEAEVVKEPTEE